MKSVMVELEGIAPYSQSRYYQAEVPLGEKESPEAYEERTWRERLHKNRDGNVVIPAMALKWCIAEAAKYKSEKIKGKGHNTWTKHFEAGVLVLNNFEIQQNGGPVTAAEVSGEWLFVSSNGQRGGGKRVKKRFPFIPAGWTCRAEFYIVDDTITEEVFEDHLNEAGKFIGIGRFRPRNGGFYGRFKANKFVWSK